MPTSSRLYQCLCCHAPVIICHRCDHGHRYCAQGCSKKARMASQQRARQKYQTTRAGRFNNAARQQRFRDRQKQKVTHHGSLQVGCHDLLKNKRIRPEKAKQQDQIGGDLHCHHCGAVCDPFLRPYFLQQSRFLR